MNIINDNYRMLQEMNQKLSIKKIFGETRLYSDDDHNKIFVVLSKNIKSDQFLMSNIKHSPTLDQTGKETHYNKVLNKLVEKVLENNNILISNTKYFKNPYIGQTLQNSLKM